MKKRLPGRGHWDHWGGGPAVKSWLCEWDANPNPKATSLPIHLVVVMGAGGSPAQ